MTESEIKSKLEKYANSNAMISKEDYEEIRRLTEEYPHIATEVIVENGNTNWHGTTDNRLEMIEQLFDMGLGEDSALFEAERLSRGYSFYRCIPREGRMLRNWLACKTDERPTGWPETEQIPGYGYGPWSRKQAYMVCRMSKYNEYMARSLVYAIKAGYPDLFREPVRNMLELWGMDYTCKFLDEMVERYQPGKTDVVEMYSVGYVLQWRTKAETQLYEKYINHWIETEWDEYLDIMTKMKNRGGDLGKKAYKKIIKPRLEE